VIVRLTQRCLIALAILTAVVVGHALLTIPQSGGESRLKSPLARRSWGIRDVPPIIKRATLIPRPLTVADEPGAASRAAFRVVAFINGMGRQVCRH